MTGREAIPSHVDTLLTEGRFDEARAIYRGTLERDASNVKAALALSRLEKQRGDDRAALDILRAAAHLNPSNLRLLTELAAVLRDLGKADEASTTYRQILGRDERHVQSHFGLGWIARAQRNEAAALEHFMAAQEILRAAADADRGNIQIHAQLATALRESGHLDEAAAVYQHVLSLDARNIQSHNGLAWIARQRGDDGAALAHFKVAAELNPSDLPAQINLAKFLASTNQFDAAQAVYMRVLAQAPKHRGVRFALGELARTRRDWAGALESFQSALEIDPGNVQARIQVGHTLCHLARWEDAAESFRRILDDSPDNIEAMNGLAVTATARDDRSTALALYERVGALAPLDLKTKVEIRRLKSARGSFDWRTEVEDAELIARLPGASLGDQIAAARTLVQYGLTEAAAPLLSQLQTRAPAIAYQLSLARRQIERMGLAQRMVAGEAYPDPAENQLEALQGFVEKPIRGSDTVLLVFGGVNNRLWMTFSLLQRILRQTGASVVYVRDLRRTWYSGGIVGLGDDVASSVEGFRMLVRRFGAKRILTLGNCIGCVGALRYGLLLGAEGVLGFHPRLRPGDDLDLEQKAAVRAFRGNQNPERRNLLAEYRGAVSRPNVTLIFGEQYTSDAENARSMAEVSEVTAICVPGGAADCVRELLVLGLLDQVLHEFVANAGISPATLARIADSATRRAGAGFAGCD